MLIFCQNTPPCETAAKVHLNIILLSSTLSGHMIHVFTSKQSHCLLSFYPLLFNARSKYRLTSPELLSFTPKPECLVSALTFVIFYAWKLRTHTYVFFSEHQCLFSIVPNVERTHATAGSHLKNVLQRASFKTALPLLCCALSASSWKYLKVLERHWRLQSQSFFKQPIIC